MTLIQLNGLPFIPITDNQIYSKQSYELESNAFPSSVIQLENSTDALSYNCEFYCEAILNGQTDPRCPHCAFWHQVHNAWKLALGNQFHQAYNLLYQSQTEATQKQDFVVQFILAVMDSLCGCYENAEMVLTQAPNIFNQYDDASLAFSAQIHLAYLYLRTERPEHAHTQIKQVLHWLSDMKIAHSQVRWWHPEVMAHILAYAIAHSIQTHTARSIFMLQIGQDGKDALLPYLYIDNAAIQRNVYSFYSTLNDTLFELVPKSNNHRVRQIIHELLRAGDLRPDGFLCLRKTLTTATQQNRPNAALIATFGLYMARYSRSEIAKQLDMSPSSIRNYITTIYEVFNLDQQSHDGQQDRFQHLLEIAKTKGYIT